jgi:hypothetical protein
MQSEAKPKKKGKAAHRGLAAFAPDRHRDALPRQSAMLSSHSAPEKKAALKRPGPPAICFLYLPVV